MRCQSVSNSFTILIFFVKNFIITTNHNPVSNSFTILTFFVENFIITILNCKFYNFFRWKCRKDLILSSQPMRYQWSHSGRISWFSITNGFEKEQASDPFVFVSFSMLYLYFVSVCICIWQTLGSLNFSQKAMPFQKKGSNSTRSKNHFIAHVASNIISRSVHTILI